MRLQHAGPHAGHQRRREALSPDRRPAGVGEVDDHPGLQIRVHRDVGNAPEREADRRRARGLHAVLPVRRVLELAQAAAARVPSRLALATLTAALERLRAEHFGGLVRMLVALPVARAEDAGYAQLTPSEREILQLLAKGASTKDVAAKTGRSPQTVDTHIHSICRKLNCSGRREAIAIATDAGWVS